MISPAAALALKSKHNNGTRSWRRPSSGARWDFLSGSRKSPSFQSQRRHYQDHVSAVVPGLIPELVGQKNKLTEQNNT